MKNLILIAFSFVAMAVIISSCQTTADQQLETRWAGEELQEVVANLESQFGGFDQTMMETNYRYNELYWAGQDENWQYAEYHLDKILSSMERGFVRRPAREASAGQFVNQAAPRLLQTIQSGDKAAFDEAFTRLASSCNTCHAMEEVPFMQVIIPEVRNSLIKF